MGKRKVAYHSHDGVTFRSAPGAFRIPENTTGLMLPDQSPALIVKSKKRKVQAGSIPASVLTEQRDPAGSGIGVLTVPHRSMNAYTDSRIVRPGCQHMLGCKCEIPFWLREQTPRETEFENRYGITPKI
jgi:hypothetical protein